MSPEEQLEVIRKSRNMHSKWYFDTYPDAASSGLTAAEHYWRDGAARGYNPGKFFETALYMARYADVASSGLNPLVHYETVGVAKARVANRAKAEAADRKARAEQAKMAKPDTPGRKTPDAAKPGAAKSGVARAETAKAGPAKTERVADTAAAGVTGRQTNAMVAEAVKAARATAAEEIGRIVDELRAALQAQTAPEMPLVSLSKQARAAAKNGDWIAASRFWQAALALPAEPYVGLSQAAAAQGDLARAEEIVQDGLARMPGNPMLLQHYCQLALDTRRWAEATRRWQMIEDSNCLPDARQQIMVADAFLLQGDALRAGEVLDAARKELPTSLQIARLDALLAEARSDWSRAAYFWLARASRAKDKQLGVNSHIRAVRAMLRAAEFDRAEAHCQTLIDADIRNTDYLRLSVEIAIAQDAWAVALERWQRVEAVDAGSVGALPSAWVYQIGLEAARRRTESIRIGRLRATGMLSLAGTIETVDEANALVLARQARKFYPENVMVMAARILSANTRHSAAIWWLRHLIKRSKSPRAYYAMLVDSLIESSRLDECRAVLDTYVARYRRDTLWLRAMAEIHYREGDFAAMREVMQGAMATRLPAGLKTVRVTRWIYDLIRLHPAPHSFLPESIHSLVQQVAGRYDSRFLADSLGMLLNPAQGDVAAGEFAAQIAEATAGEAEINATTREEMLQFFLRRRDWPQVEALLDLPLPDELDEQGVKKVWNLVRNKIDILLGRTDIPGAEKVACDFLDQLAASGQDGYAMTLVTGLLFRLPLSAALAERFKAAARRVGFTQMDRRISDWQTRYSGFATETTVGIAQRERCFIVGNAPSIANMPLHLLQGEDIFSVNRGMRAVDVGLPRPKYLFVADPLVYKNHAREIDDDGMTVEKFFVASNCLWRNPPTVPCVPVGSSGLKLSLAPFRHAPLHLHRGETVVVLAAQIAHLMGYKEIYIIGVDLDYSGPATHFYVQSGGGQKETERLANFRPGGSGTEMVNLAFANLQQAVASDGCRLYNAAPAGKLDALPRVDFETVLRGAKVPQPEY